MKKRVFLYVNGEDYSALIFEENYDKQKFYEEMVRDGVTKRVIETETEYIEVEILEFGEIDDRFISFIRDRFMDYDYSKHSNFYEVTPLHS